VGYYYYGLLQKRTEFDDAKPPKVVGGFVILKKGTSRNLFNEKGIEVTAYFDWMDGYTVKATIPQLNELFESGLVKVAEPVIVESIRRR
jgi:hypothetical protein